MDDTEQPGTGSDVLSRMTAHFGGPAAETAAPADDDDVAATPATEADESDEVDEQPEVEQQAAEAGLVEIETDEGEKYQVPAKLKDAFLRQRDYTQKTQEIAELRRQASVAAQHQQVVAQFQQAVSGEQSELAQVHGDLAKYKALDWQALDVETYIRAKHQMDTLKERAGEIEQSIGRKAQAFQQWRGRQVQEVSQAGANYLKQAIPNWNADAQADARRQAAELGYSDAETAEVYDPRFVRALWKAAQFDKLQAGKPAAVERAKAAPPIIKPGASQGANVARESQYKKQREQLRKSGDYRDAAKLLLMR
jgi:hypothetical protein